MSESRREARRGIVKWAVRNAIGTAILATASFASAGTLDWHRGWWFTGILVFNLALSAVWLIPTNPEVLVERSGTKDGTAIWDRVMAPLVALSPIAIAVVAGLHHRFAWVGGIPGPWGLAALGIAVLASVFVIWAMAVNAFFSGTVRIQSERGHRVIDSGPYRFVRHPGYLGAAVVYVCFSIVLGSAWALIPAAVGIAAIVVRTRLEDDALRAELSGYDSYVETVRYRLFFGIW